MLLGLDAEFAFGQVSGPILGAANEYVEMQGNVGADGARIPFEIRPRPSEDVEAIVKDMKEGVSLLVSAYPQILENKIPLTTASAENPLGTHLHFDWIPPSRSDEDCGNYRAIFSLLLGCPINAVLPRTSVLCRLRSGYGKWSDARFDLPSTRLGCPRMEYRMTGGFWGTPKQTLAVLYTAKVIADHIFGLHEQFQDQFSAVLRGVRYNLENAWMPLIRKLYPNLTDSEVARTHTAGTTYLNDLYANLKDAFFAEVPSFFVKEILHKVSFLDPVADRYEEFLTCPVRCWSLADHWKPTIFRPQRKSVEFRGFRNWKELRDSGKIREFQFRSVGVGFKSDLSIRPIRKNLGFVPVATQTRR